MQTQDEQLGEWRAQLASAKRQLGFFESGRMRWLANGVDRSDAHVAALKQTISGIEKLLAIYQNDETGA